MTKLLRNYPWRLSLLRLSLLALVFAGTWGLPYLVPVPISVSVSYVVQFSNRTAVVVFALGSLLYAWITRGVIGARNIGGKDKNLNFSALILSLGALSFLFWAQRMDLPIHGARGEAPYCLDRLQSFLQGLKPYRDFEFAYGPLHLYVPYVLIRVVHLRPLTAYAVWLWMEWMLGISMLWYVVRCLPFHLRWRHSLFWAFIVMGYPAMFDESVMYTPLRSFYAAWAIVVIHRLIARTSNLWLGCCVGLMLVAVGLGISPEQGTGVAAGLLLWYAILTLKQSPWMTWPTFSAFVPLVIGLLAFAAHEELFRTARDFSAGAFCYPLCPSAHVGVVLCCYVATACYGVQRIRLGDFQNLSLPMLAGGFAMLPAALGRADLGHLQMASPALLFGVGVIQAHTTVCRWWTAGALIGFIGPASLNTVHLATSTLKATRPLEILRERGGIMENSTSANVNWPFPCDQNATSIRKAPFGIPSIPAPLLFSKQAACADSGYYFNLQNAFTESAINLRVEELQNFPARPIILLDAPVDDQFPTLDAGTFGVKGLQKAFWMPKVRRSPLTQAKLVAYIEAHYAPDAVATGRFRIWRPKITAQSTTPPSGPAN